MKALFLILLSALIFVTSASSGTVKGFTWSPSYRYFLTSMDTPEPPDGGLHAFNNTGCAWNDEDQSLDTGNGDLIGETTDNMCLISDYAGGNSAYPKNIIAKIYVPKTAQLLVWLTNDQGDSWDASRTLVVPYGNQKVYEFCYKDPVAIRAGIYGWRGLTYWPLIPGTNGYGQKVNYTIHIQANKVVHNFWGYFGIAFNYFGGDLQPDIQQVQPGPVPCS